jgi:hypothetical protein
MSQSNGQQPQSLRARLSSAATTRPYIVWDLTLFVLVVGFLLSVLILAPA